MADVKQTQLLSHSHNMNNQSKPLVRTNVAMSGNIQMIVDTNYKVKFSRLTGSFANNANEIEFDSIGGSFADNAVKTWARLCMSAEDIFAVQNSNIETQKPIRSLQSQYDWQYVFGCRHKKSPNQFRWFAPLWVVGKQLPKWFMVFQCPDIEGDLKTLLQRSTLLCKWNLSKLSELEQHVKDSSFAPCWICHNTEQTHKHWGYDINTGKQVEVDSGRLGDGPELSPFDFDKWIVDQWRRNNIACSQLVNLCFDFECNDPGVHRFIGLYADYESTQDLKISDSLVDLQYYDWLNQTINLIEYTDAVDNKTATVGNTVAKMPAAIDYARIYEETVIASFNANEGLRPNIYTQPRVLNFQFTGKMIAGESFTILVNGKEDLKVYCVHRVDGLVDRNNWFQAKTDLQSTIDAFIKAFNNAAMSASYAYEIEQKSYNELKITSNCGSNNIELQVNVSPYSISIDNTSWEPVIDFETAITKNNSLLLSKSLIAYIKQANYLLLYINETTTIKTKILATTTVQQVTGVPGLTDTIIVLVDAVVPDLVDSIAFDMLAIRNATSNLCKLYDYHDLSGWYWSEDKYMRNTEFNVDAWYDWISKLAPNATYANVLQQYVDAVKTNDTPHAIESLGSENTVLEFSDSEYDKCKDLTVEVVNNKPNIRQQHFVSMHGLDALNKPWRANDSIAYNCTGLAPYELLASYSIDAFTYSWFIEGFDMPPYIAQLSEPDRSLIAKSYVTSKVTIADFENTDEDAFNKFLMHKFDADNEVSQVVECWSTCYEKPGSSFAWTTFKGVDYVLSSNYIGYRFAVVHIDGQSIFSVKPNLIVNHKFKFLVICLPYKIVDRACTNLDGFLGKNFIYVDKSLLYSSANVFVVEELDNVILDCLITIGDVTRKQWNLAGALVTSAIATSYQGLPAFAASVILQTTDFQLGDVIKVGDTIEIRSTIQTQQGSYDVVVKLIDIVDVSYDTLWFRNATYDAEPLQEGGKHDLFNLLEDLYNVVDPEERQDIFDGSRPKANNLITYAKHGNFHLPATTYASTNRFAQLAYFVQFNKIAQLQEIQPLAKTVVNQTVQANYDSPEIKLSAPLTRYGQFVMPELVNITKFATLKDMQNVIVVTGRTMKQYALLQSDDIWTTQHIDIVSTNRSAIYLDVNSSPTTWIDKYVEVPLIAMRGISATKKTVTIDIPNAGMQTNQIDLLTVIVACLNMAQNATVVKYAEFLLDRWSNMSVKYEDAIGMDVKPLTIDSTNARYLIVTFDAAVGDLKATFEFA